MSSHAITHSQLDALLEVARQARERAYAPYSRFAVGAALMDETGRIHAGCNVENAAYPEGLCAEAVALGHLIMAGGKRIVAAVVVGDAEEPVTPCGGCRQKLREFAAPEAPLWVADLGQVALSTTVGDLLPASFGPTHLSLAASVLTLP